MTTEEQLEKVEKELAAVKRQVRRLVIAGAVGVGCFVILLAVSAVSARPVGVRARKFVLVDEKGKTRALLAVEEGGPGMRLFGEKDKVLWSAP